MAANEAVASVMAWLVAAWVRGLRGLDGDCPTQTGASVPVQYWRKAGCGIAEGGDDGDRRGAVGSW